MKKMIIITVLLIGGAITAVKSNGGTEQQPFELLKSFPEFEIRHYPQAIVAKHITGTNIMYGQANNGFRVLANYIFGGNTQNTKIAMTAPVHMGVGDQGSYMLFVMPSEYQMEDLPAPLSNSVQLTHTKPETVAAIRFGGWANEQRIEEHIEKLSAMLENEGIIHDGDFRYLGYNSPYRVVNRRNEIIVGVQIDREQFVGNK